MNLRLQNPDNFNERRLRHRSKRKIQKAFVRCATM
jgi:hypothetical protein